MTCLCNPHDQGIGCNDPKDGKQRTVKDVQKGLEDPGRVLDKILPTRTEGFVQEDDREIGECLYR